MSQHDPQKGCHSRGEFSLAFESHIFLLELFQCLHHIPQGQKKVCIRRLHEQEEEEEAIGRKGDTCAA